MSQLSIIISLVNSQMLLLCVRNCYWPTESMSYPGSLFTLFSTSALYIIVWMFYVELVYSGLWWSPGVLFNSTDSLLWSFPSRSAMSNYKLLVLANLGCHLIVFVSFWCMSVIQTSPCGDVWPLLFAVFQLIACFTDLMSDIKHFPYPEIINELLLYTWWL